MTKPLLSVLLPNYNNAPYLKECLDSLFGQSFQDFVIYFVDDHSTDDSVKIAESYGSEKLVVIKKQHNSGIVDTLNEGLDRITSKYYIRMDGDDLCSPDRFEKLVNFMENNENVDVCTSYIQTFGTTNDLITYEENSLQNKANLIFCHTVGHASSIFRTSTIKNNRIRYKNDFWRMEDYQLFYLLKNIATCTCLPEPLYYYRRGDYNLNPGLRERKIDEFKRFYAGIFKELVIDPLEGDLIIHTELSSAALPTHRIAKYKQHVKKIIAANHVKCVFPQKQLEITLTRALNKMCYRLLDTKQISFSELFPFFLKWPGLLRYYAVKRITK